MYGRIEQHLFEKTGVRLNMKKIKVFNYAELKPPRVNKLQSTRNDLDPVTATNPASEEAATPLAGNTALVQVWQTT